MAVLKDQSRSRKVAEEEPGRPVLPAAEVGALLAGAGGDA